MALAADGFPGMPAIQPLPAEVSPRPRRELIETLAKIDGWGPRAWREIMGAWQLRHCRMALAALESGIDGDQDENQVTLILILQDTTLGGRAEESVATCDWLLREAWRTLLVAPAVRLQTYRPRAEVRASNACWQEQGTYHLRLFATLPFAGMCCDGKRFARLVRAVERFAAVLARRRSHPGLTALRRCVRIQRLLRARLPELGLVGFLGDGAAIARTADDQPSPHCRALRAPRGLRTTIDLGGDGRFHGLGIRQGVTAIVGAPYHGKSTMLAALASGRFDHVPGDGRELVVALADAVVVQSEEGRRIKAQDVARFFTRLPGADSTAFSTERASGATSMAASVQQACAAGSRLLLIDEDSAAANFLAIDPTMARLLGPALHGTTGLLESLPAFSRAGISTVLVAGSSAAALQAAERVILLSHYRASDASARVRRLLRSARRPGRAPTPAAAQPPANAVRRFADQPDCLLGPRHFLLVDASEAERPVIPSLGEARRLDLRRCGWPMDAELARGACAAAAWCCRLAEPGMGLRELEERYRRFLAVRGVCGLDPFHTQLVVAPPWQLVVAILERLPRPALISADRAAAPSGLARH